MRLFPKMHWHSTIKTGKAMFAERKVVFHRKAAIFPRKRQKERKGMKNNNQINIPQAREAMDRFKMQAAQDEDVFSTS